MLCAKAIHLDVDAYQSFVLRVALRVLARVDKDRLCAKDVIP